MEPFNIQQEAVAMHTPKPFATMTATQRRDMEKVLQGLELGPNAGEAVLAEGQVFDFLKSLYNTMEADGVTQGELARRMHVRPNQIHRWLSTESSLKASTMFLLARMLGYELELSWRRIDDTPEP